MMEQFVCNKFGVPVRHRRYDDDPDSKD
jgi:hypothetical protein